MIWTDLNDNLNDPNSLVQRRKQQIRRNSTKELIIIILWMKTRVHCILHGKLAGCVKNSNPLSNRFKGLGLYSVIRIKLIFMVKDSYLKRTVMCIIMRKSLCFPYNALIHKKDATIAMMMHVCITHNY